MLSLFGLTNGFQAVGAPPSTEQVMKTAAILPDEVTFNAAIGSCEKGELFASATLGSQILKAG